ncbi:hypothetical protein VB618_13515 [Microvirga sp. CF3062]|uniref:hypothetical protein n=1 Tax=Microvirga sp. CF3062 TaxID=3110182 RepID=UPI002E77C29F|nr:hypothetical protein [Microvirga sp. CF3062]MEE1657222.1 hypothetical protein [Microvirga sp. CF3062]
MSSLFGLEAPRAVQFAIAFAIILILLVLLGLVLRKVWGGRLIMPGSDRGGRSRQPRLGIVDVYDLDRQRQLLLLRRDNVEHLLLIGGPNDVVIETNIVRVAGARIPAPSVDMGAERFEPSLDQSPRAPQVESNGRPSIESQLAAQLGAFVRRPSEESDSEEELSPVAQVSAPVPAHPEPVLKPDAVAVSASPSIQGLRAEARTPIFQNTPPAPPPPPPVERPEPRPQFTPPPFQSRATPVPPAPPAAQQPEPIRPPEPAASERSAPDASLLSDMAKQLEEALKRPANPVSPPAAPPQASVIVASPTVHEDISDEEAPPVEPTPAEEEPVTSYDEPVEEEDPVEELEAPAPDQPAPPVEPVRTAPPPPPASAPLPPQAKEPASEQKAADPFSVEDIEAEFARLLGRPLDPNKKG